MTNYAGETFRITTTSEDFEGTALTPNDIDSMWITVYDSTGSVLVSTVEMSWSATELLWFYLWTTKTNAATPVNLDPGTYRAKVTLVDLDGHENWEFKRIRLARNPV